MSQAIEGLPEVGDTLEWTAARGEKITRVVTYIGQDNGDIEVRGGRLIGLLKEWPTNIDGRQMAIVRKAFTMPSFSMGLYRHYKGGVYRAIGLAQHHESRTWQVIYVSMSLGSINVRPLVSSPGSLDQDAWMDRVEVVDDAGKRSVPRFEWLGHSL